MQYRKIEKSNDMLSVLGYGCMRFPIKNGSIDKERALSQIRRAIDNGVNYLDTAYPYHNGASESFLGEYVLKDGYREKVKIATKLPVYLVKKNEDMEKFLNKQLSKLQLEYVDYYLLHAINGDSWDNLVKIGIKDFMDKIKKEGKVKNIGFSFHGPEQDFNKIIDAYDWDICQIQLNILDENYQAGISGLNYASKKGIGVIIMEPLRGGQLSVKIPDEVQKIWDEVPIKRTPADWALRWLWNFENVKVVLSGMNDDAHIDENIRVASEALPNTLSEDELLIIEKVKKKYQQLLSINCTGCKYCIDCPAGIDIPFAFQSYNNYKMFKKSSAIAMYAGTIGVNSTRPHWTSTCINCGKCEKHCPQFIQIRNEFKKVQKTIEHPAIKVVTSILRPFVTKKTI